MTTVTGNIFILAIFAGYMLPWIIALGRSHPNVAPIFIINVFFGWTFIGWVVALAWSASVIKPVAVPEIAVVTTKVHRSTALSRFFGEKDSK
jgi:Superinfection immunity protein